MLCAIWYHLNNLKSEKNNLRGLILSVKLQAEAPPWMFFSFFKQYKWYQITLSVSCLQELSQYSRECCLFLMEEASQRCCEKSELSYISRKIHALKSFLIKIKSTFCNSYETVFYHRYFSSEFAEIFHTGYKSSVNRGVFPSF